METLKNTSIGQWILSHLGLTVVGLIAAATFVMVIAASTSLSAVLPYFLLLLCPLAHFFLHGGHSGPAEQHVRHEQDNTPAMKNHKAFDSGLSNRVEE